MDSTSKPWGGRFAGEIDRVVEEFTASVQYDRVLYPFDILGSQAHALGLARAGVLNDEERDRIVEGLSAVQRRIEEGQVEWNPALEDVHMNIEAMLVEEIGEVGKKLHTGRSRNDQVATDLRLYARDALARLDRLVHRLQTVLVDRAETEAGTIMPGFTHLQSAQPVTLGHHLLAWYEMLQRDRERLADGWRRSNRSPLGAGALAGSGYDLDREYVAELLGFESVCRNSLDAVSDRDFVLDSCYAISVLMVHLSRMSEEIILWMSPGFRFASLPDALCTGSSLMPQKKNPDLPELIRGRCARACGALQGLLMLMKGQPLAYNRDNQEDKEPLFDCVRTACGAVPMMATVVSGLEFDRERMHAMARDGYSTATDLADALVAKGIAFRDAHRITGQVVAHAVRREVELAELAAEEVQDISSDIDAGMLADLTVEQAVATRGLPGGTAPGAVLREVEKARETLRDSEPKKEKDLPEPG